jgi:NADPH-dependent curcumin reductase CurA
LSQCSDWQNKSANPEYDEGSFVLLWSSATESYSSVAESALAFVEKIDPKPGVPLTAYMGLLGMTGKFEIYILISPSTDIGEA